MSNLTKQQIDGLRDKMKEELVRVINKTRDEICPDVKANYIDIIDSVPDSGDEAVADTLIDTDNAIIGQHLQRARDVDAALERIQAGLYGACIECGGEIGFERLTAYPTAKRCIECQSRHEKTYASKPAPTL